VASLYFTPASTGSYRLAGSPCDRIGSPFELLPVRARSFSAPEISSDGTAVIFGKSILPRLTEKQLEKLLPPEGTDPSQTYLYAAPNKRALNDIAILVYDAFKRAHRSYVAGKFDTDKTRRQIYRPKAGMTVHLKGAGEHTCRLDEALTIIRDVHGHLYLTIKNMDLMLVSGSEKTCTFAHFLPITQEGPLQKKALLEKPILCPSTPTIENECTPARHLVAKGASHILIPELYFTGSDIDDSDAEFKNSYAIQDLVTPLSSVKRDRRLTNSDRIKSLISCAKGLCEFHDGGVIHGDVSLANCAQEGLFDCSQCAQFIVFDLKRGMIPGMKRIAGLRFTGLIPEQRLFLLLARERLEPDFTIDPISKERLITGSEDTLPLVPEKVQRELERDLETLLSFSDGKDFRTVPFFCGPPQDIFMFAEAIEDFLLHAVTEKHPKLCALIKSMRHPDPSFRPTAHEVVRTLESIYEEELYSEAKVSKIPPCTLSASDPFGIGAAAAGGLDQPTE